jgi:hypothetical protein
VIDLIGVFQSFHSAKFLNNEEKDEWSSNFPVAPPQAFIREAGNEKPRCRGR